MASKKLRGAGGGAPLKAAVAPKTKSSDVDKIPSRDERAEAFMLAFNKQMKGRAVLKPANQYRLPYLTKRFPTGILTLDLALRGGFPAGGLSEISGPKNAGKTYLVWQMIRQLQNILGQKLKVLFAQTEMRADRMQGRLAGVQIALAEDDILSLEKGRIENGWPPFSPEENASLRSEIGTFHELHGESAEDLYDGILGGVEGNIYHLIVIDSFGSIMSGAEAESETLSDKQYSGASAVNSKFCRKLAALLTMDDAYDQTRDVCLIGINQVRDAIGENKEFRSPGGRALEHAKFVGLFVNSGKQDGYEESKMTPDGRKARWNQTGKEVNWNILKGKAGIHEGGRGSYIYDFRINAANFYLDTLVAGVQMNVVETAGAWLGIKDPQSSEYLLRAQGKDKFIEALAEDARIKAEAGDPNSLMNFIRSECFRLADINIDYDWES